MGMSVSESFDYLDDDRIEWGVMRKLKEKEVNPQILLTVALLERIICR